MPREISGLPDLTLRNIASDLLCKTNNSRPVASPLAAAARTSASGLPAETTGDAGPEGPARAGKPGGPVRVTVTRALRDLSRQGPHPAHVPRRWQAAGGSTTAQASSSSGSARLPLILGVAQRWLGAAAPRCIPRAPPAGGPRWAWGLARRGTAIGRRASGRAPLGLRSEH